MSLKLHPSYITDIQSLGLDGESLSDLWIKSNVPMYSDSDCLLIIDNPCSMEVINIADIRFKDRPTITIMDNKGNELYVDEAMAIDETFGSITAKPIDTSTTTGYFKRLRVNSTNEDGIDIRTAGSIAADQTIYAQTFTTGGQNVTGIKISAWDAHIINTSNPHSTTFAQLLSKPTTLAGFGITDGVSSAIQYTNPTWLVGIDSSIIKTGTIDPARLPVIPTQAPIVSTGDLTALTTTQQNQIVSGTIVTTTDGNRYVYNTGTKTLVSSYIQLADITPDWSVIGNRPINVSYWANDAGYATPNSIMNWTNQHSFNAQVTFNDYVVSKGHNIVTYLWSDNAFSDIRLRGQGFIRLNAETMTDAVANYSDAYSAGYNGKDRWRVYADGHMDWYGGATIAGPLITSITPSTTYGMVIGSALKVDGKITANGVNVSDTLVSLVNNQANFQPKLPTGSTLDYIDGTGNIQTFPTKMTPYAHTHAWADITSGKPTTLAGYGITDAASSSHTHTFASLTSKPTTLAGYGITDAATSTHAHTFASLTSKPTTLSGYGITDAVGSSDSRLTDARTPINNSWYVQGGNATRSTVLTDFNTVTYSTFASGNSATGTPVAGWHHLINVKYTGSTTNDWNFQIAAGFGTSAIGAPPENYYVRIQEASAWKTWRKLWHDGNLVGDQGTTHTHDQYLTTANASSTYQPLENQRLSTTNSPTFAGATLTGAFTGTTVTAGNAFIGTHAANTGWAEFTHVSNKGSATNYNVLCLSDGTLNLNAPSGKYINFSNANGASIATVGSTGFTFNTQLKINAPSTAPQYMISSSGWTYGDIRTTGTGVGAVYRAQSPVANWSWGVRDSGSTARGGTSLPTTGMWTIYREAFNSGTDKNYVYGNTTNTYFDTSVDISNNLSVTGSITRGGYSVWDAGNLIGDRTEHYHSSDRAWGNITSRPAVISAFLDGAWAGPASAYGWTSSSATRFGFSSSSGVVDVYADGNFYATDSMHRVWHAGDFSSATIGGWNACYDYAVNKGRIGMSAYTGEDALNWAGRNARGNHFGRMSGVSSSPAYYNFLHILEATGTNFGAIGYAADGRWYVTQGTSGSEPTSYQSLWTTGDFSLTELNSFKVAATRTAVSSNHNGLTRLYRDDDATSKYYIRHSWTQGQWYGNAWRMTCANDHSDSQSGVSTVAINYSDLSLKAYSLVDTGKYKSNLDTGFKDNSYGLWAGSIDYPTGTTPFGNSWTWLQEWGHSDGNWRAQLGIHYFGDSLAYRRKENGTWKSWRYCVTTDSVGTVTNKIESPRITSQRSSITAAGTYQVDTLNDIIVVTSAGVTLRGFVMDGVVTIYNAQDTTVIYDNNGSIYYQQGTSRNASITIPARRCLIIRGGVRNYPHVSLD